MEAVGRHKTEKAVSERRASRRYPTDADIEYKVVRRRKVVEIGRGRAVNLSSTGVLFESPSVIPPGTRIDLSMAWPAQLSSVPRLHLCISGKIVRVQHKLVAVRILSYEFRVRGRSEADEF